MFRKIVILILISLSLVSCNTNSAPPQEWNGIPIYPEATNAYTLKEYPIYIYTVQASSFEVEKFYKEKMALEGWEYLQTGYISQFKSTEILFTKDKNIVTISLDTKDKSTEVGIKIEEYK